MIFAAAASTGERHSLCFLLPLCSFIIISTCIPDIGRADDHSEKFLDGIEYFIRDEPARKEAAERSFSLVRDGAKEIALTFALPESEVEMVLWREACRNLQEKIDRESSSRGAFPLAAEELFRTVLAYEIFKLRAWLGSGVFPKRYFGYVDQKWDTAGEEAILLDLTHRAVQRINRWQIDRGRSVRLNDLAVIVTYLSEGGARLLLDWQYLIRPPEKMAINLYYHHGCDNIGEAIRRYPDLVRSLDEQFGTALSGAGSSAGNNEIGQAMHGLNRRVTYRESLVANALMYLFEKENAERKLRVNFEQGEGTGTWSSPELMAASLEEQFVASSLVFNTGALFSWPWVRAIRDFDLVERLSRVSRKNSQQKGSAFRPALPVPESTQDAFDEIRRSGYPKQPTSWQGGYHILQRYGAFRALADFTDLFDEKGMWTGG